jgi:hypothetical protein
MAETPDAASAAGAVTTASPISKSTANEADQAPESHASTSKDVQEEPIATADQDSAVASVTETPAQSGVTVPEEPPAAGDDQNPAQPQVSLNIVFELRCLVSLLLLLGTCGRAF